MKTYDVIVIGAGPAGYVGAIRAAQLDQEVAIIEKEYIGGVCLNMGCIPSKSLLRNAELTYTLRERAKEFGISFQELKLDYGVAINRSRQVANRLVKGVEYLLKKNKIDVFRGNATLNSKNEVNITADDGSAETLNAEHVVVATGARPSSIPGVRVDGGEIITYKEAILLRILPKSAVIIGGGPIGVEFATLWNSYGVPVTIVEMMDRLLPQEDEEVSRELEKAFAKRGITVINNSKVLTVEKNESSITVHVESGEGVKDLEVDLALVATGFVPNSEDLGLEEMGVKRGKEGFVKIDETMATNISGIWAIGDVTGKRMLAHVGSAQGIVCAENISDLDTITLNYKMMPRAVFSCPQVASFGYSEKEARERGYEINIGKFPFRANGKALSIGEPEGFVKIISDVRYGEILGAHMVGPGVAELLPELTLAHNMELTPEQIAWNVHAHPTLSEAIMEAAHIAIGSPINI